MRMQRTVKNDLGKKRIRTIAEAKIRKDHVTKTETRVVVVVVKQRRRRKKAKKPNLHQMVS